MKFSKKLFYNLILSLTLAFSVPAPSNIHAAGSSVEIQINVKLNKKSTVLIKGQSTTLKVLNTSKKATWKSSNTSVASVNSNGKVTAKKKGTATITATVLGKKYTCKVTVTKNSSSNSGSTTNSNYVWIPKTATKYHKTSTCSGMNNPQKITLAEAKINYEPCKKCYK